MQSSQPLCEVGVITLLVQRKKLRPGVGGIEYLVKDSCGKAGLVPGFLSALPAPGGGLEGKALSHLAMWSVVFLLQQCLFWGPESREIRDEVPECPVTLSKAASPSGPQFPER